MNNFFSNTFLKVSVVLLSLLLTLSCNDAIEPLTPINSDLVSSKDSELTLLAANLRNDSDFIRFLEMQDVLVEKFNKIIRTVDKKDDYVDNLMNIIESGDNSYDNVNKVALLSGFDSVHEYTDTHKILYFSINNLLVKYPIIRELDENSFKIILESANSSNNKNNCRAKYDNCRNSAHANLALATTACAGAAFIPVAGWWLAPSCELAAIWQHSTSIEKCGLDYQDCNTSNN